MGLITAKFTRGRYSININDTTNYWLAADFRPPSVSQEANIAGGTSANRTGGAELIGLKAVDRPFTFSIHCHGESEAEVKYKIGRVNDFIQSGTSSEPVYLEVWGNSDTDANLTLGQYGANYRYEVVYGLARASDAYTYGGTRTMAMPECRVELVIKPYTLGRRTLVATAKGGILEDIYGAPDGYSRGVIVPDAITNKFTNPIFGHSTWNNGWTAGANLNESKNTDPRYVMFGNVSARITKTGSVSRYTQSINVGNTNAHQLSCYAKRPDSSAITETQARMYYNGITLTTTWDAVGDGWYRGWSEVTGVAIATTAGISIQSADTTLFVDGFQIEQRGNLRTSLVHGDMLDCDWTSTAHNSTSTRTSAYLRWPASQVVPVGEGTFRVVWKAPFANTKYATGSSYFLFSNGASSFQASYGATSDVWNFTDGTNSITGADTFAAGEIIILHFVYGSAGLKIYLNGTQLATGGTYTAPTLAANLYLGSSAVPDNHSFGTFLGFAILDQALSATEVGLDAANITEWTSSGDGLGKRLEATPWLWTKDGDNVVDNCDDSTRDNFCVIGGVPGSQPAETVFYMSHTGWSSVDKLAMSLLTQKYGSYYDPGVLTFFDQSGTVGTGLCGGEAKVTSTGTTITTLGSSVLENINVESLVGVEFYTFTRLKDASATTLNLYSLETTGPIKSISVTTTYALFYTGPNTLPNWQTTLAVDSKGANFTEMTNVLYAHHDTGTSNVTVDYFAILPRPLCIVDLTDATTGIILHGMRAGDSGNTYTGGISPLRCTGDAIELEPERLNAVITLMGDENEDPLVTYTFTYDYVEVVPRWALL